MNNPRIVDTALRFLSHELGYDSYPELVGWQPTPKHFDSSKFFKEDLPLSLPREGFGLRESDNFLYGKPPEKPAVSISANGTKYSDGCRKAVERWNLLNPKYRIIIP